MEIDLQRASHDTLQLDAVLPLESQCAGIMISRGSGRHIERIAPYFVLLVVRTGVLHIEEDGREFEVNAGESLLLWPGRLHRGTRDHDEHLQFYWMHFAVTPSCVTPSCVAPLSTTSSGTPTPSAVFKQEGGIAMTVPQHTRLARPDFVTELFRRYLDDQDSGRLQPLTAALYTWMILAELADTRPTRDLGAATVLAGNAQTYIRLHFHKKISASQVARALGYSVQYLGRAYQRTHGVSISEEIRRTRIGHARTLLLHTNRSVGDIAHQCGFEDSTYFLRVFKQLEGITPLRFRRLHARMHVNTH